MATKNNGVSLPITLYEVLLSALCEICEGLEPTTKELIGPYRCRFRSSKSISQLLNKTAEKIIDKLYHSIDFKAAFDITKKELRTAAGVWFW